MNCEGYDYPDDPYILEGSCALRYTLEYTPKGLAQQSYHPNQNVYSSYQRPVQNPNTYSYSAPSSGADWSSSLWTALIIGPLLSFVLMTWCGHVIMSRACPLAFFFFFFCVTRFATPLCRSLIPRSLLLAESSPFEWVTHCLRAASYV